ncbi:MAG: transcription initiation factor IIB family protein [Promethearchaeota archaeon]|nr:MAG: transcription initiation factor IIB family protein [Candidatus Lokiarchaeota archaeon]
MKVNKHYQDFEEYCPECGGRIISKSFERLCESCGLVVNRLLDRSNYSFRKSEDFNNSSKQYVALGNRTDFIGGLGTYIGYENSKVLKDKMGKLLSPNEQKLFRRLKKNYGKFLKIKDHETEYRIFRILKKISIYLNLNKNVRNNAAYYYKKIKKKEKNVINNISLIAFCIFNAARKEKFNAPITINEIATAFQKFGHRVNPRLILRDGLRYKKHLEINAKPHKSEDYLTRLINQVINHKDLELRLIKKKIPWSKNEYKINLMKMSRSILEQLSKWERGGRNPFILTGAIIYLADKLLTKKNNLKAVLTQKLVSEATKIAEYSIRDHYVNLLKPHFIENKN